MKRLIGIFLITLLFCTCKKDASVWDIKNLNNNSISCFGHSGMGIFYRYPINSEKSFERCFEMGADGTDFDVQLSKDNKLVLFHDRKMEDGSDCDGYVYDKNWDEIKNCLHKTPLSGKQKIIPANSILDVYGKKKLIFTFDCKLYRDHQTDYYTYIQTYADVLLEFTDKYEITNTSFFETIDTNFIRILLNKKPDLNIFFYSHRFEDALAIANNMNLKGITMEIDQISAEQVDLAHANNRQVTLWNVHTENQNIEAIEKNPDHIQSDKLKHLLKIFDKYKK
ncbi:MAG: glycerophosphodiester phosphodiesterase family protein [Bacteroidota bacterium]|nr:glycerophosphodiester phosphodiesterase family protein [Bacteroidota bacterium]